MKKTIRWGILGTGYIARKFAEGLINVENAELYAVASRNMSTAKAFASDFNDIKYFCSYEELVSCPEIDVVYIATPHNSHCDNTIMSLENGKNVLCEKPFAVNKQEVQKMIDTAKRNNLFLMEAFWTRFLPHMLKIKELIDNDIIGNITLLKSDIGFYREYDNSSRLFNKELIGGSLLDIGIYPLFLSQFILGKPLSIQATAAFGPTGVDHSCAFNLNYPNTTLAILYSSLVANTETIAEIHGSKGCIKIDSLWFCPNNFTLYLHNGKQQRFEIEHVGNGYNYEAQEVTNCLLQNKKESNIFSHADSLQLIDTLDSIRKIINLNYPMHDKIR